MWLLQLCVRRRALPVIAGSAAIVASCALNHESAHGPHSSSGVVATAVGANAEAAAKPSFDADVRLSLEWTGLADDVLAGANLVAIRISQGEPATGELVGELQGEAAYYRPSYTLRNIELTASHAGHGPLYFLRFTVDLCEPCAACGYDSVMCTETGPGGCRDPSDTFPAEMVATVAYLDRKQPFGIVSEAGGRPRSLHSAAMRRFEPGRYGCMWASPKIHKLLGLRPSCRARRQP